MKTSYEEVGLKVGLEIHQQLNTTAKLFCNCKPELSKDEPETTFLRRLRPTQSELGQTDPAAYFEFQRGIKIMYEADKKSSCLVEMDEEPPHSLDRESLDIALTAALMTNTKPVDEVQVMRKTVIDGSNTTGFQRTCVVGLNGEIRVGQKKIPIQHIGLEEDAARKIGETEDTITYRIDRLGIPLLEVATAPVMEFPEEAAKVALAVGKILRATGRVQRGLGTIRQDLNISIRKGALIEIKGVQELSAVSSVLKNEVTRQLKLLEISEHLRKMKARKEDFKQNIIDVKEVFKNTRCKLLRKALDRDQHVLAVRLPKFHGLLKIELMPNLRLGTEIADRARFWGRVGGIFHTDELPAYGITVQELEKLKETAKAADEDAVVFVAGDKENALDALGAALNRAEEAVKGVPEETRTARPDGTTRYMRPRPGAARMYPETDIPPVQITAKHISRIRSSLPEMPEQRLQRLAKDYGLNRKLARQIMDSHYAGLFETIVKESNTTPTTAAVFLTETLKALKRDGTQVENVSENQIREAFQRLSSGQLAKEALPELAIWLSKHPEKTVKDCIEILKLGMLSEDEVAKFIEDVIQENFILVQKLKEKALGPLMGIVMKKLRGRVAAASVNKILKEKISRHSR